ncbi:DnaJ domain protein [Ostertagia ostertagi]
MLYAYLLDSIFQWQYEDFIAIKPSPRNATSDSKQDEFVIHIRQGKGGKRDTMRFSSDYTAHILTDCLQFNSKFSERNMEPIAVNAYKHSWSDRRLPVILRANAAAIEQVDSRGVVIQTYPYRRIRKIVKMELIKVADCPGGFIIDVGDHHRRHLFASTNCDDFLKDVRRIAADHIGVIVPITKEAATLDEFARTRLGLCSRDDHITSYAEFKVQKYGRRHEQPVRRLLCLTEICIVERDPASYAVVCATPLEQIVCLVRLEKDPQQFVVEYKNGEGRVYSAAERDLIIASLIDGARAAGNEQVFVTGHRFDQALRLLPHGQILDEDGESQCMRHVIAPPPGLKRSDLIRRFNANIPYTGLTYSVSQEGFFTENKGKVIVGALEAVLGECYEKDDPNYVYKCEAQLQCLRRLFASKSGFQAFTEVPGVREKLGALVIRLLSYKNEAIDYATVEALCALMHPMHNHYELRTEQLNKQSLLSSTKFVEHLLDLIVNHVERGTGWLVIAAMLDFLTYAVCAPYSETTAGEQFDQILKLVAARGQSFYRLFQCPSMTIVKGAGMVMRAIIEESDVETSKSMQMLALTEGAFLTHLRMALLTTGKDLEVLTNKQLSGHLIGLWIADNRPANDLLSRCLPRGLLDFLDSSDPVPVKEQDLLIPRNNLEAATNELRQSALKEKLESFRVSAEAGLERFIQHWDLEQKLNFIPKKTDDKQRQRPVVLRKRRQRVRNSVNWKLFAYQFGRDHSQADLLWNEKTREEFRLSIEGELRALLNEKEQAPADMPISWNHTEFQVSVLSLLFQTEFFNNVYHRFLLSSRSEMRCLCLRAMAVTYGRHHMTIGPFEDARHFVSMLAKCTNAAERDHFILLISKLVLNKDNVRELIGSSLLPILVDLAVLAHLHVQRAKIQNQTNVIEASADQLSEGNSAEWYYATSDNNKERLGPFSFEKMKTLYGEKKIFEKTAVWAAGMEKWEPLSKVPQFRWTVCLGNQQHFPMWCKLFLLNLQSWHGDRVLITFTQLMLAVSRYNDPDVRILSIEDNPFLPRLYLSGVFFFILMYNGSNVLPIARFLHYTHKKQAFRTALPQLEGTSQSILAPLLPAAAIFYLDEYGPDKYAEVFLGEFDNPEIIWSTQMRRHLIERIAVHVSDFSNRLTSNVKALYQYCPIPLIDYPELQNELFCYVYYLRHLCDRQRFPDWEIRDPIPFLRACLAAWFEELEKKPPVMSVEQARETLGLNTMDDGWQDMSVIRRAYFKLAARYHPDKNPEGREMFERINTAYELLSSDAGRSSMPDPQRIVLFLQAQSIIYSRHSQELSAYKYAGYGQLIRTIDLEAKNSSLFQEGGGALLSAAVELANHTLMSSALNAEQLRREQGLEALQIAFDRCVPVITASSTPTDMAVQVCEHICNCFATAASFEACRQRIAEMPTVFGNICRLLQFPDLPRLSSAAAQCVCSMAVDTLLQTQLFQSGVLWQLVPHLFHYDFTLDEGGVSHSEQSNKQAMANRLARVSCEALACLAGFREATPDNDGVQNSLRALLTPYVCRCMRTESNDMVLKTLNCNTENPYLIWDNGTRAEVLEFVERHRTSREQTSELFGAEFQLSIHAKELIVGDIFVRIYNEQPTFVLQLFSRPPQKVAMDLLDFMGRHAPELTGGLLYILSVLCSSESDPGERLLAAELLTKLQSDKLTGPRWTRFITKYLPPIFADALRDSPNTAITMFDSTNENPELIWNETTRVKVRQIIERGTEELYRAQSSNPEHKWDTGSLTDNTCAYSDSVTGELVVGGVFVRLYVANPAWAVRHPRQFATELIEKVLELMNKPSADLTLVTTAFIELLRNFPNTADQLPAQGYLPQFSKAMSARDPQTSRSAILILQQLAENHYCADALSRINCIEGIMTSMKNQPTLMHESAHALKCLMRRNNGDLAAQMLSTKMVDYLLEVLHGDLPGTSTGVAGYLTEGMFSPPPLHTQPPPMEKSGF